jgi:hypothetical protein
MTTGEQEHTRGDPRRGRPARYACCAPLATYLLTWPLRPPGDTTRHPYTAAHLMAEDHLPQRHHQCNTMPPLPSGIQKPSAAAAYPKQQLLQRTHVTSWQHNQAPTYSHYPNGSRPPATTLPPTQNNLPRPADPQADTHTPCQRLLEKNPQRQLLNHPLGHLTTPNRHPPTCTGPMPALLYILYLNTCIVNV